jgi:hypothetical protein
VGFLFVVLHVGEEASFFFFFTKGLVLLAGGNSMLPERFRGFVVDVRGNSAEGD